VLARRNTRLGRGDRRGAARLAFSIAGLTTLTWALAAHHVLDATAQFGLIVRGVGIAVLVAAMLWLFYLALEPYVRRLRPWTLVSWTRALNGGTGDRVVGRDVLIGMTWGAVLAVVLLVSDYVPRWLGQPSPVPDSGNLDLLLGTRQVLAYLTGSPVDSAVLGLGALLLFLILRLVTRRDFLAVLLIVAILSVNQVGQMNEALWFSLPLGLLIFSSYIALMLRFGVLAAIAGPFTVNLLLAPPQTWALGSWVGAATPLVLLVLVALAVFAFRTALGSRSRPRRLAGTEPSSSRPS
jgi:hypothetical protein